ncbi:MAG: HXXEE domain-containing protein [Anaerolineae bacterium]|nr:HXXEE domain-containing protein [Anaerolineae bacterium]
MTDYHLLWLFFPLAITLHNIEEAIWLPKWSQKAGRFHKPVVANEFYFAVLCVTLLAYLSTFFALAFPDVALLKLIFFGFLGTMILNIFMPHLAATILLRQYAPGLLTGLFGMIPINGVILALALSNGDVQWGELIVSTVIVAVVLLASLPLFFRIGRQFIKEN